MENRIVLNQNSLTDLLGIPYNYQSGPLDNLDSNYATTNCQRSRQGVHDRLSVGTSRNLPKEYWFSKESYELRNLGYGYQDITDDECVWDRDLPDIFDGWAYRRIKRSGLPFIQPPINRFISDAQLKMNLHVFVGFSPRALLEYFGISNEAPMILSSDILHPDSCLQTLNEFSYNNNVIRIAPIEHRVQAIGIHNE